MFHVKDLFMIGLPMLLFKGADTSHFKTDRVDDRHFVTVNIA